MMDKRRPTRTLIAGGAGFIGSHLCERFLRDGHEVICVDNLLTGRISNISHLMGSDNFSFVQQDISSPFAIEGPVDNVLHFACPASPIDYLQYPLETLRVGSYGTWNLLELAHSKRARFLFASTSEVYGDPLVHPQRESYWGNVNPIGPRSVYDESKRFSEAVVSAYQREKGLETRIVRIFNTYGPRMRLDDGRVLPTFMGQALRGEPLSVFGDGSQTRSFCYVDDLLEGIVRLLASDEFLPVNVGNPEEITIREFAEEVISMTGSRSTLTFHPLPTDDPRVRKPDITRAFSLLNWYPRIKRQDGIRRTLTYFRNEVSRQVSPDTRIPVITPADRVPAVSAVRTIGEKKRADNHSPAATDY
jgi:dTDP-glucose 4,6-dehydratase